MATADRVLAVLGLFSLERPEWTVEAAAGALNLSQSTAYQYFRSLIEARMLVAFKPGRYVIGPAIIELDRQMRRQDPLIGAAAPAVDALRASVQADGMILLCRIYGSTVMCVEQQALRQPGFDVSYERGRPMPLIRGAASKAILAHLQPRFLRRYYGENTQQIADAKLGASWQAFQGALRAFRRAGVCVTEGELDAGFMGISGPVFGPDDEILGSIGLVLRAAEVHGRNGLREQLIEQVRQAGRDVSLALQANAGERAAAPSKPVAPSKPQPKSKLAHKDTAKRAKTERPVPAKKRAKPAAKPVPAKPQKPAAGRKKAAGFPK